MRTDQSYDLLFERLFAARKWAVGLGAVIFLAVLIAGGNMLALCVLGVFANAFLISACVTWFYIFRIMQSLHGTGYAFGHVVISVLLTPVFLTGLILVPLLVRGDVERLT